MLFNNPSHWMMCSDCQGQGKKSRRLRKKVKLRYQRELAAFEKALLKNKEFQDKNFKSEPPTQPTPHLENCLTCNGSGLLAADTQANEDSKEQDYPHLAIIGGGIGGVALAVACLHRNIPFTLYERDSAFDTRSQGYGLTLQQASRAIEGLGIVELQDGITSTRHVVHTTEGKVIADWGIRDFDETTLKAPPKRTNVHIARQSLRLALLEQLGGHDAVQWGHQLVGLQDRENNGIELQFKVQGQHALKHHKADLVVGTDGIRSAVRNLLIGEQVSPLRYLDCIVILGICPLAQLKNHPARETSPEESIESPLLDGATVFQSANGHERIYMMPFKTDSIMWQLSFPMTEESSKALSAKGPQALKEEALSRCQWHEPIPQILAATHHEHISGYPVYDRAQLEAHLLTPHKHATLIGDAAHPMSPFKGQGANQALLDALALARGITKNCGAIKSCGTESQWRDKGIRESVLNEFENHMLQRSASKVKGSADAAEFLHSDVVLHEGNEPRGRVLLREKPSDSD